VILALPTLARDPNVVSTVVIDPFTGTYPEVEPEPPEGFDAQVAFDVRRARRALWPAIDPARTMTHAYPTDRHAQLASGARERLARVSFEGDAEIPAIARYFAQPFTIAEPFTSRPGERTEYATMLDEVEALLTSG
jgi:F0F1-type ATP synthase beta subunit